jgi:hypothetical protein
MVRKRRKRVVLPTLAEETLLKGIDRLEQDSEERQMRIDEMQRETADHKERIERNGQQIDALKAAASYLSRRARKLDKR